MITSAAARRCLADLQKNHRARQQFLQQQNENEMVLKVGICQLSQSIACSPFPPLPLSPPAPFPPFPPFQELELLDDESKVYKMIGPALVRQDQLEASSTVRKRLEYIAAEMKRLDAKLVAMEEKSSKKQAQLGQLQTEAARMKQAAGS